MIASSTGISEVSAIPSSKHKIHQGPVMAIGGAEDKFRDREILSRFAQLAGGPDARIVVIPTASSIESAGERYKAIFLGMGVSEIDIAVIGDRPDANRESTVRMISQATGIFMTGGNQMRLAAILGGTGAMKAILERNAQSAVVAGTSAGASILSAHMVAFGSSGNTPKQRMAQMVAGFGLIPEAIIDQHFRQRDRLGRLMMMVATNPSLLGVGVDEDTAAIFTHDGCLEVLGRNSVTIIDAADAYTDVYRVKRHGGITLSGARIHVLTSGHTFDTASRALVRTPGVFALDGSTGSDIQTV
ncbi:MAG: cyanophycinase [Thermomicrobiales bacterium]|nr:cyanophycinase [Thermomicrobiales bacterium]MCO5221623.1 cyanophycinase [Thermomicrobiales bacterium]